MERLLKALVLTLFSIGILFLGYFGIWLLYFTINGLINTSLVYLIPLILFVYFYCVNK